MYCALLRTGCGTYGTLYRGVSSMILRLCWLNGSRKTSTASWTALRCHAALSRGEDCLLKLLS